MLSLAEGRYRFGLVASGSPSSDEQLMQVVLKWGEHGLTLACPPELIGRLLADLDPDLSVAALPPDLLGLLIEAALHSIVTDLEQRSGQSIEIVAITNGNEPAGGERLLLTFDDDARRWLVELVGRSDDLAAVLRAWPVEPRPWPNLPIPAVLRLGTTRLHFAVLRSLVPDDTVLLQTRSSCDAILVLAELRLAAAEHQGGVWRLKETPRPAASSDDKEWIMQSDHVAMTQEDLPDGLDEIPVQLAFDLGRVEISLGELRRLGVGAVLETSRSLDGLVRISANGRLIGSGTLVDVEGRVGVQIVRLFDHE